MLADSLQLAAGDVHGPPTARPGCAGRPCRRPAASARPPAARRTRRPTGAPRRPARACTRCRRRATSRSTSSPARWPRLSLNSLKRSTSRYSSAKRRSGLRRRPAIARSSRSRRYRRLGRPVSGSCITWCLSWASTCSRTLICSRSSRVRSCTRCSSSALSRRNASALLRRCRRVGDLVGHELQQLRVAFVVGQVARCSSAPRSRRSRRSLSSSGTPSQYSEMVPTLGVASISPASISSRARAVSTSNGRPVRITYSLSPRPSGRGGRRLSLSSTKYGNSRPWPSSAEQGDEEVLAR